MHDIMCQCYRDTQALLLERAERTRSFNATAYAGGAVVQLEVAMVVADVFRVVIMAGRRSFRRHRSRRRADLTADVRVRAWRRHRLHARLLVR